MRNWKQKVGNWHVGQLVVAVAVLLIVASVSAMLADSVNFRPEVGESGVLFIIPVLFVGGLLCAPAAVVVLWIWFGARGKS